MTDLLDRVLQLWTDPVPADDDAAVAAFRQFYADPVTVNGTSMPVAGLVARARAQQAALADLEIQLLDVLSGPGRLVLVFLQRGRHVGPLPTPLGELPATGQTLERQVINVLTLNDGLITDIRVVADDLNALVKLGALELKG